MIYRKSKKTTNFEVTARKAATWFLSFLSLLIFLNKNSLANTEITTDCAEIDVNSPALPGNNCLFSFDTEVKKLCSSIPQVEYQINSNDILSSGQIHRHNCVDLIDLPLCDTVTNSGQTAIEGRNCVSSCNAPRFGNNGVRGVDHAVHNRDCIRFCDEVESENNSFGSNIANSAGNSCVTRYCHQYPHSQSETVLNTHCPTLPCNLLNISELNNVISKRVDNTLNNRIQPTYCNGTHNALGKTLKCYNFSQNQLPYVDSSFMCVKHNCSPQASQCPNYESTSDINGDGVINNYDHNDALNISDRNRNGIEEQEDIDYKASYETYINSGYDVNTNIMCSLLSCKPIITKQYRCTNNLGNITGDNSQDQTPNSNCTSGCSNGYCTETIDCNLDDNSSRNECKTQPQVIDDVHSAGTTSDSGLNSWFYRPRPMEIATADRSDSTLIRNGMNSNLCYSTKYMKTTNWGEFPKTTIHLGKVKLGFTTIDLGTIEISLGYYHSSVLPDSTRSPGHCTASDLGFRGTGYIYLCYGDGNPNGGQLYSKVANHTAYHKGYVETKYSSRTNDDNSNSIVGEHKLTICLRFRNSMRPDDGNSETCGKRQCAIDCAFGLCETQKCGRDVCRTLTIDDSRPDQCKMDNEIFSNDRENRPCMAVIDDYLRLRIQQFGNKICSFLDVKGQTAHEADFFATGDETVIAIPNSGNSYCLDGSIDSNCNGKSKNTTDDPGSASKWRTISFSENVHIPYILNNQPPSSSFKGYIDRDGQLFAAQDCIKVSNRVAPPVFHKVETIKTTPKIFQPPIYILAAMTKKNSGLISFPQLANKEFGETDFNYPEIKVVFGTNVEYFNLDIGDNGSSENENSNASREITTTVTGNNYSAELFVTKEFDQSSLTPIFCLNQKNRNSSGDEITKTLQCVDRKLFDINIR